MLLAGGRSGPSSARLRTPRAVTPAGGRGTNQVPSSNPLEKRDFQFILPKSDKGFTGSLCWIYKNPKPGTETQNTGEGGPAAQGSSAHLPRNDQCIIPVLSSLLAHQGRDQSWQRPAWDSLAGSVGAELMHLVPQQLWHRSS